MTIETSSVATAVAEEIQVEGDGDLVETALPVRGMSCQACIRHVRGALESMPGVMEARVDLAAGLATVRFDPARTEIQFLQEAIEAAGYVPGDPLPATEPVAAEERSSASPGRRALVRPVLFGFAASLLLLGFYAGTVTLLQGSEHAVELFLGDWYLVLPIGVGFGVQVGLLLYIRNGLHLQRGTGSAKALAGASTGTSSVAMLACCAHHLTDVLPFLGLSAAAAFLSDYRQPLMVLGIVSNVVGIAVMLHTIRRTHCHV